MLEELAAAAVAPGAGQHARVGGGVDNPIGLRQAFEIAGIRISPWITCTPRERKRPRFISEPGRRRLSTPKIDISSRKSSKASARAPPTKPHTPVMKTPLGITFPHFAEIAVEQM